MAPDQSPAAAPLAESSSPAHVESVEKADGKHQEENPSSLREGVDSDLADHDLTDHDHVLFHPPTHPWRHLTGLGIGLFIVGLLTMGIAAMHLGSMSAETIGNAVRLPQGQPVIIRLDAGEQRMLYTERGSGASQCVVADGEDAPVSVEHASPVLLQGSDVLWQSSSIFTARQGGDYTVTCSGDIEAAKAGRPVGTLDVVLTVLAAGLGGISTLAGIGLMLWGRRRPAKA
ncbi:hypothetical protein [Austwickia chelonae]|uniref:hypothetical protein n=1 Tax=Austwickia chelonae TaxID=100225 RepID=UPI00196882A3|nr:hypothetical protein [Austwickia chelonae]